MNSRTGTHVIAGDVTGVNARGERRHNEWGPVKAGGRMASMVQMRAASGVTGARLVQHLLGEATARGKGAEPTGKPTVHEVAARGVSGGGGQLPYFAEVQRAFGRHDLSTVRSHQGQAASEASRAMGASAYACGESVAFAGQPGLFTVAHEAAHVVQQRSGRVSLEGGVGKLGDVYEQHADAVAAEVVAGGDAEGLLDRFVGEGRGGGYAGVQMETAGKGDGETSEGAEVEETEPMPELSRIEVFNESFAERFSAVMAIKERGGKVVDQFRRYMEGFTRNYGDAVSRVEKTLLSARIRAQDLQGYLDTAIGLSVGALVAVMFTATGVLVALKGSKLLAAGAKALIGGSAGAGVKAGGRASGFTDVAGKNLKGCHNPKDTVAKDAWDAIIAVQQVLLGLDDTLAALGDLREASMALYYEAQLHPNGGMDAEGIWDLFNELNEVFLRTSEWEELNNAKAMLDKLEAESPGVDGKMPTSLELEKMIWVHWIASLDPDQHNVLDLDPIEVKLHAVEVLGPGSTLNVDFGFYTESSEEEAAITQAKALVEKKREDKDKDKHVCP